MMRQLSKVRTIMLLLGVLFCASCSSSRLPHTEELYSQPIVPSQRSPSFIKQLKPSHLFWANENHPSMIFCTFDEGPGADTISRPALLLWENGVWQTIDFSTQTFEHNFWSVVSCARNSPLVWGVMEYGQESLGTDVRIVLSENGGRTWTHIASLAKPYYLAYPYSLRMDSSGHGALIFHIDDNYSQVHGIGYYTHTTNDWGKTWSKATFMEDILQAAPYEGSQITSSLEQLMKELSEIK